MTISEFVVYLLIGYFVVVPASLYILSRNASAGN